MIILTVLILVKAGYSTTSWVINGAHIEMKYFDKSYLPTGISIDGNTAKSLLACASLCSPKNCTSLFYEDSTRWCKINEELISFPAGTTFQSHTADYIKFIEFKEVKVSFLFTTFNHIQYNLNGSNTDGSFTVDDSNSFFSPYKILPIAQENKYLGIFFLFYHGIVCCVLIRIASSRRF